MSPFGALLPTSRLNPGLNWMWRWRNTVYPKFGTETISIIPYIFGQPTICTRSLQVAKQMVSPKGDFIKGEEISAPVIEFGHNLFSVEGEEWKRHRRILNPAFTPSTYALVWEETSHIYDEIITSEGWSSRSDVLVENVTDLTMKFALVVISRCGFGNRIPWDFTEGAASSMSFAQALVVVSNSNLLRMLLPRSCVSMQIDMLLIRIQDIEQAFVTLDSYMANLIQSKRESIKLEQENSGALPRQTSNDIFTHMIRASEGEGKLALKDSELAGNTFLMLFGGHDTTAHTLQAAVGLLALYQEHQEEVYQQIMEVSPKHVSELTFQNASRLFKVRAAFLEGARLFPAVQMMLRDAQKDSVLQNVGPDEEMTIPVPKGTRLVVDIVGVQYNERYHPDPEAYKLERWYDTSENDMTMFSFGPRSCIGRRFALTETTCFLARLLRDWRLDVILEKGETREQWRARAMQTKAFMTLRVNDFPVRLVRRR
ncbi:hypothetical protein NM688_g784 [Phlebia brevispora]|uniref:Uncharacterized protein n=1 Tax=Phlebia brevispora TaxID=194682 RepID=A0ACC1TDD1_9APHY|nr:hypothetical protein NM688_g784 [Phlebia brevispora]